MPLDSDLVLHLSMLAAAWALQLGQIQVPKPVGFVNDFARVISPDAAARLQRIIADVRAKSGGEIVVVTLPNLGGRDATDVAREIARQWKVGAAGGPGDRARNAGVVILIVPKETSTDGRGHSRVEVGSGAEGFLTDATTGAFQEAAIPLLREREYSGAIELITARVAQRYAREFAFALDNSIAAEIPQERPLRDRSGGIPPFFWFILLIVIMQLLTRSRRRRRGCGGTFIPIPIGIFRGGRGGFGGGGGGGFSGFGGFGGGGGFSGGGSGRSW